MRLVQMKKTENKITGIEKYRNIPDAIFYSDISIINNLKNILNKFKNKAIVYGIVNDINKIYMLVVLFMEMKD